MAHHRNDRGDIRHLSSFTTNPSSSALGGGITSFHCSPLVSFSSVTQQEHAETLQRLEEQKLDILERMRQLTLREAEECSLSDRRIQALNDEEAHKLDILNSISRSITRMEREIAAMDSQQLRDRVDHEEEVKALECEIAEMLELEASLRRVQGKIVDEANFVSEKKREFARSMEHGIAYLTRFQAQGHELAAASVPRGVPRSPVAPSLSTTGLNAPRPISRAVSPPRKATSPQPLHQNRVLSPRRAIVAVPGGRQTSYVPPLPLDGAANYAGGGVKVAASQLNHSAAISPTKSASGSAVTTARSLGPESNRTAGGFGGPSSESVGATTNSSRLASNRSAAGPQHDPNTLHGLCENNQVEAAIALIKANPASVNMLDSADDSPLHVACGSSRPSLPLVRELLLAGASTSQLNRAGLSPFHVAVLNPYDLDHALKRFLIFKAAVNPNQRTAKGETVAHLCAVDDRYLETLKFLSTVGVDFDAQALSLPNGRGNHNGLTGNGGGGTTRRDEVASPQKVKPLDASRKAGAAAHQSAKFLEALAKQSS